MHSLPKLKSDLAAAGQKVARIKPIRAAVHALQEIFPQASHHENFKLPDEFSSAYREAYEADKIAGGMDQKCAADAAKAYLWKVKARARGANTGASRQPSSCALTKRRKACAAFERYMVARVELRSDVGRAYANQKDKDNCEGALDQLRSAMADLGCGAEDGETE